MLRLSVMATHTDEQLRPAAEVVGAAVQQSRVAAPDPVVAVA